MGPGFQAWLCPCPSTAVSKPSAPGPLPRVHSDESDKMVSGHSLPSRGPWLHTLLSSPCSAKNHFLQEASPDFCLLCPPSLSPGSPASTAGTFSQCRLDPAGEQSGLKSVLWGS